MRILLLLPVAMLGCSTGGLDAVSIRPIYGWVDGCTPVKISGNEFGTDVSAKVIAIDENLAPTGASADIANADITQPDPADTTDRLNALNAGFLFYASMPPSPTGSNTWADIEVTSGGVSDTIPAAYYYQACPAAPYIESYGPADGLVGGETLTIAGCNLNASAYELRVISGELGETTTVAMSSVCGTAEVSFTAPTLTAGSYEFAIYEVGAAADASPVYPLCYGDTGDTGYYCDAPLTVTYGGGE